MKRNLLLVVFCVLFSLLAVSCEEPHVHTFSEEWSSDETNHWHEATCEDTDEKKDVAEHVWDSGKETEPATCTEKGVKTYTCTVCKRTRTEEIPAKGHSFGTSWKSNGTSHWHECSCGEKADVATHTWNGGKVTKEATYSEDGTRKYTCTVCDRTATETFEYTYAHTVTVKNVTELINALNNLQESTKIVLAAGTYDFEGNTTSVSYGSETGWMIPIIVDNVKMVAADGATVKICSTDNIGNGNWATQDLILVAGKNFVLDGISVGIRGSKNKSIEVISENSVFKNCKFVDGGNLYINKSGELECKNTNVSNCVFEKDAYISFSNGADTLKLQKSTFKNGSIVYLTGIRESGWNNLSIKISSIDFEGNDFQTGSTMILKATETDYASCFGDFDPVTLFGMTLTSNVDPVSDSTAQNYNYNTRIKTYEKK